MKASFSRTVYTLTVALDKEFYAFKKETNSLIKVTIYCEAQQWSRVKLSEKSPDGAQGDLHLQNYIDPSFKGYTYHHPFQIPTPINGRYTIIAEEYSPYNDGSKSHRTTVEARVHGKHACDL